ncbi:hypothetical protein [Gaoshiqia sp. Z1-71]|uniref:hypothetical protein n=1 Tax=Gaoshiqia hydrogeniformans TaxID=3290090 RepID=UPI003BF91AEC
MKTTILKIGVFILLLSLMGAGCEKEEDEYSSFIEGYIVGTFICDEVNAKTGEASGDKTRRGYCIVMEGSELTNFSYPLDFYTFDLSNDLFDFPNEILSPNFDSGNCGPNFFPDNLRNAYKIKFKYQILNEYDESKFVCGACTAMELAFPWEDYRQIKLKDITINN